jgi:hypothetical protein
MNTLFKTLIAIFTVGALSLGCGLTTLAEEVLTPLILYVSTSGNDVNDCLSEATACLTLQAALDKSTLNSTINIGPGHFYVSEDPLSYERPVYDIINGVALVGAGSDQTILHSNKFRYTLGVSGSIPVVIRNLGIDASGGAEGGINVSGNGDILIENCRVFYAKVGVLVQGNGIARLNISKIENNRTGVQILGGIAQVWNDSLISENGIGVRIDRGGSADIMSSVIEKNVIGISNNGNLDLSDTMLAHNTTQALDNTNGGDAIVGDSTFDSNGYLDARPSDGRRSTNSIISNGGEMSIHNSIISNNYGIAVLNATVHIPQNDSNGNPIFTYEMTLDGVQVIGNGNAHLAPCAIANNRGFLKVQNSNIQDNKCVGVDVYGGEAHLSQSSIIDNKIGLFVRGGSSVYVTNTTISRNYWFGIEQVDDGHLNLNGVTVASNRGVEISASNPDTNLLMNTTVVVGGICSINITPTDFICNNGWNTTSLGLGPLTEERGTKFFPLLPGSPLIDAGVICTIDYDQRGHIRPTGGAGGCDVGAYESDPSTVIAPLEFITPSGGVPGVVPLYTDTPAPTLTPVYTDTPQAPTPIILTFIKNAFCRKGPGSLYRDISGFKQGDTAQADGRNDTNPRWWWVQIPNNTEHCWVSYVTVDPNDLAESLPIQPISLQLPVAPSSFAISKRVCSQNGYSLLLAWSKSGGADGYTLYLNGQQIATFKANQTTYQEKPPLDKSLHYELEAFNQSGFSERLVVEDRCP